MLYKQGRPSSYAIQPTGYQPLPPKHDDIIDPDYDESSQGEFADEFTDTGTDDYSDPDSGEAPSQEWYLRKQK